eukprot:84597_1
MAQSGAAKPNKQQYSRSVGCPTSNYAMILCKNKANKYLSLNGDIPSFYLSHSNGYTQYKEDGSLFEIIKQKCGLDIEICGILRIEHTENNGYSADMRVIYYAEPMANNKECKQDDLTKSAKWIDIPNKNDIKQVMKNSDLYSWINYVEYENGIIYPMNTFCEEGEQVKIPNYSMPQIQNKDANYFNLAKSIAIVTETANNDNNDEEKTQSK